MANSTSNRGGARPGTGQPSPWGEPTVVRRVPRSKANKIWEHLVDLPEAIDLKIEELQDRQTSERVKLAWAILQELQAIYKEN